MFLAYLFNLNSNVCISSTVFIIFKILFNKSEVIHRGKVLISMWELARNTAHTVVSSGQSSPTVTWPGSTCIR